MTTTKPPREWNHPHLAKFFERYPCPSDLVLCSDVMGLADWYEDALSDLRAENDAFRESGREFLELAKNSSSALEKSEQALLAVARERDQLRAENEELREDAQRIYTQYLERGVAMRETGDMVRSLYEGPSIVDVIKERDQLRARLQQSEAVVESVKHERDELRDELADIKSVLEAVEEQAKKNSSYHDWRVEQAQKQIAELTAELGEWKQGAFNNGDRAVTWKKHTEALQSKLSKARAALQDFCGYYQCLNRALDEDKFRYHFDQLREALKEIGE